MNQYVNFTLICFALVNIVQAVDPVPGALSTDLVTDVQLSLEMDTHARAMQNALTATGIKDMAQNRQVIASHNTTFSHKIDTKGISNQKSSGRCWMFAGFNTLRPMVLRSLDIDTFEFSHIYLQFWDKFEKANTFLELVIARRDQDILDRELTFLMKSPCPDGGYWENFVDLVTKYGVLPKEVMVETASSEKTGAMNRDLARVLRRHADQLLTAYRKSGSVAKMRQLKREALVDVYKILVLNLGEPPKEFTWRHKVKADQDETKIEDEPKGKQAEDSDYNVAQALSERKRFTPQSFYETFIGVDLTEYVNLADDPIRPKGTHIEILMTCNLIEGHNARYANVGIEILKQVTQAMLLDNQAVYFAADVSPNQDSQKGIMEASLYDFESVYDLSMDLDKRQRLLLRDSTVNHGMAFIGVDLKDNQPVKWLVENSWGSDRGDKGLWTMYDNWFDEYVYYVIAHKKYVPQDVLEILEKPAQKRPVWDPMW